MKKMMVCVAVLFLISGFAVASEKSPDTVDYSILSDADTTAGDLDGSDIFDRRFLVTYDGTCNATSSDSSNDGTPYQVFEISSPVTEALEAEVVLGTLGDSVLFVYCDPFDPLTPEANLRAWDDDDGVGYGSAITPADGYMIEADTTYFLVVGGYGNDDFGDFTLNLGGNAVFGQVQPTPTPSPAGPTPVPTLSHGGMVALMLVLAGIAVAILARRR